VKKHQTEEKIKFKHWKKKNRKRKKRGEVKNVEGKIQQRQDRQSYLLVDNTGEKKHSKESRGKRSKTGNAMSF